MHIRNAIGAVYGFPRWICEESGSNAMLLQVFQKTVTMLFDEFEVCVLEWRLGIAGHSNRIGRQIVVQVHRDHPEYCTVAS